MEYELLPTQKQQLQMLGHKFNAANERNTVKNVLTDFTYGNFFYVKNQT